MNFQDRFRGKMTILTKDGIATLLSAPGNPINKDTNTFNNPNAFVNIHENRLYKNLPSYPAANLHSRQSSLPGSRRSSSSYSQRTPTQSDSRVISKTADGSTRPKQRLQLLTENNINSIILNNGSRDRLECEIPYNRNNIILKEDMFQAQQKYRIESACARKDLSTVFEEGSLQHKIKNKETMLEDKENNIDRRFRDLSPLIRVAEKK